MEKDIENLARGEVKPEMGLLWGRGGGGVALLVEGEVKSVKWAYSGWPSCRGVIPVVVIPLGQLVFTKWEG